MRYSLSALSVLLLSLLLAACTAQAPRTVVYKGSEAPPPAPEEEPEPRGGDPFIRQRILADMLYEARLAFEDNRLMAPSNDNAYDRYQQVLDIDPGNEVAREGIQNIVLRYIELADVALQQAELDEAAGLLARAERLNPERAELAAAKARLEAARKTRIDSFELDPEALSRQSLELMTELAEIASYIQRNEAVFLINARSDAEGRWIYKVMRESLGGYRLRGNIDISAEPGILVTIPRD